MITYGSTTLTSYNTITKIEVYYYKSTSATSLSGGSWSTTKPTWENGKYIWQKIRTTYEGKLENGQYYSESDPVNITGQQGATGTSAYSYKLNASDTIVSISKNGIYSTNNITFSATYKQGTGAISAYAGRFKIETTADGATWTTQYTSSANESSKKITLPENILVIRCSLYQAGGTTVLLDIVSVPIVKDGTDGALYPNLTPFFSHDLSDVYNAETNPNGYWVEYSSYGWTKNSAYTFTQLEDGWLHVHVDNSSGTTTIRNDCCIPRYNPSIKRATMYTFLVEFRNNQSTGVASGSDFYLVQQSGSVQFWGQNVSTAPAKKLEGIGWVSTQITNIPSDGSYAISRFTKYSEPEIGSASHWTTENDMMVTFVFRANAGAVLDYDVRLSVYEGEYWGGYVPYIISDVTDIRKSAEDAHYKIDNMEIGGRNILLNSATNFPKKYGSSTLTTERDVAVPEFKCTDGLRCYGKTGTGNSLCLLINSGSHGLSVSSDTSVKGQQYVLSMYLKNNHETNPFFVNSNIPSVSGTQSIQPGEAKRVIFYATGNDYHVIQIVLKTNAAEDDYDITFWHPQIEFGNKVTDWTPAPEDVEQEISTLRTDLQSQIDEKIQTFYQSTNPALSWTTTELRTPHDGDLWYYTGTTTSTYIKDNVYRYNASNNTWTVYSASGELFDKVDGKSTIFYGTTSGTYTGVETGDYLVDSTDGSSYRYDGSKWVKVTDYQGAIDAIEIGGRNLLQQKAISISHGGYAAYDLAIVEPLQANQLYTIQLWDVDVSHSGKTEAQLGVNVYYCGGSVTFGGWNGTAYFTDGHADHLTLTFMPTESNVNHSTVIAATTKYIRLYNSTPSVDGTKNMSIGKWKLEKGNKATDWSLASEDLDVNIGGRNLLYNSATMPAVSNGDKGWRSSGGTVTHVELTDPPIYNVTGAIRVTNNGSTAKQIGMAQDRLKNKFIAGEKYTQSCWVRASENLQAYMTLIWISNSQTTGNSIAALGQYYNISTDWTYIKIEGITLKGDQAVSYSAGYVYALNVPTNGWIEVCGMKLEKGNKATDWTPAPEDIENLATAVYGTCSTAADTPLKEVVCENFILFDGARIQVAFENANSANVPSLNVNNTGAKQILINQAIVSESNQLLWAEDAQMEFVYDGTYWVLQNAPYSLYGICSVTEEIPEKVIECAEAVICKGTTITIDFMYSNTSDNTVFNVANIAQKPLLVNGDVLKVNSRFNWHAGAIRTFYFDGQAWNMSDDIVSAYIDEYETEQNEDGIMVHPVGQKNTGWSIGSTLELLKNGVSYIKMWFDKIEEGEFSLPFIRIGKESGNHVLVGDDAVTIREDQKELAHYSSLGITFDDETPYKIGNDTTYIAFEDTDNDTKADSLRIVADSISFHSNGTEKDLRSELEGLNENIDLNAQAIEQNTEAIENTQKYIQIDPEVPSIKLATNDRNYLLIESNKLGFWVDANETAYMSQNQMNIPTASITNLLMQTTNAETGETIGQIGWVMRTNGHLSLKIMN